MAQDSEQKQAFTCLIADDSEFARRTIANIVSKIGGKVVGEAGDGINAVDAFMKTRPDLVLLDITMPRLDGIGTLGRIMEQDKQAKVIIISSLGNKDMVLKAVNLGASGFLTKPYSADYASLIISGVLKQGRKERSGEA